MKLFDLISSILPDFSAQTWFILVGILLVTLIAVFLYTVLRVRKIRLYQDMLFKDSLTNLHTSAYLKQHFNDIVVGYDRDVALYYINIDNFKNYNDIFGHHIADELLKAFANILCESAKPSDSVFRVHSDRFIVLFPQDSDDTTFTDRLLKTLKHPIYLNDHSIKLTLSIGRYNLENDQPKYFQSILRSELALEAAKRSGKDKIVTYSNSLKQKSKKAFDMFHFIKDALQEDKFDLQFQPIVLSKTEKIVGVESLLRVNESDGLVFPEAIIDYAETFNMIEEIDYVVAKKAFEYFRKFKDSGVPLEFLSLNISSKEIHNQDFIQHIVKLAKDYRIPPKEIIIEFTETLDPESIEREKSFIKTLKAHGFKVAIDDFGSGYSSLMRLSQTDMDRIKIDRSFVMNISENKGNQHIVKAMVELADAFNLEVIVEGVETKADLEFIRTLSIKYIQGYHFYKAKTASDLIDLFA